MPGTLIPPSNVVPFPHLVIVKDKDSSKWLPYAGIYDENKRLMMRDPDCVHDISIVPVSFTTQLIRLLPQQPGTASPLMSGHTRPVI